MQYARLLACFLTLWFAGLCAPATAESLPPQLERLSAACSKGYTEACYDLGRIQRDSDDSQIRKPEAAARASKAACDLKHLQACNDLGELYATGEGVPMFRSIALYLYDSACTAGLAQACYNFADLTAQDEVDAVRQRSAALIEWSCKAGYADACARWADDRLTDGSGDVAEAKSLLEATCKKGNAEACFRLGDRLIWGNGLQKDVSAGLAAFKAGCDAGGGEACERLGDAFAFGTIAPRDAVQATAAYFRSCERRSVEGCEKAARAQYLGNGIPADKAAALALFEKICARNEARCRSAETIKQAPIFDTACAAGNMQRCHDLAEILNEPNALLEDSGRALTLFSRACDGDVAAACLVAGKARLISAGHEGGPQVEEALLLMDQGCSLGNVDACYDLAESYAKGLDGITDDLRAANLYARACDQSDKLACSKLEQFAELLPDRPVRSAGEDFKPPLDDAAGNKRETKRNCVVDETVFDGRVFTQERCKPPVRVMRGFAIAPGSAPWQALIERPPALNGQQLSSTSRVLCGGSLIEQGWVLTAAHCLYGDKKDLVTNGYRIRLGLHKISEAEGLSYPIRQVIQHPGFRNGDRTLANDIALIQYDVKGGKRLGPSVGMRKIRVDNKPVGQRQIYEGMTAYAYGWGWTEATNSAASQTLRGGKLALRTEADCNAITRFRDRLSNVVLCASGPTGDQACYGDSGGPLVYYGEDDGAPTLIGVISSGKRCGTMGEPSRYTRVAKSMDWIRPIVWPSAQPASRR